jgi:hypothetical protein
MGQRIQVGEVDLGRLVWATCTTPAEDRRRRFPTLPRFPPAALPQPAAVSTRTMASRFRAAKLSSGLPMP